MSNRRRSNELCHNGHDGVLNHQPRDCLLNLLFRRISKKIPKLRVTGLCVGNSPGTGEFPAQMASGAENVSSWWRHHALPFLQITEPNGPFPDQFPAADLQDRSSQCGQLDPKYSGKHNTINDNYSWPRFSCQSLVRAKLSCSVACLLYMGQVTEMWLSCYLVLLSIDSKTM